MGSSYVDPAYIDRLQDDIRIACQRLEEHGHESLVITVNETHHDIIGSKKGTDFLQERLVFVTDFVQYCLVSRYRVKEEVKGVAVPVRKQTAVKSNKTLDSANIPDSLNTPLPATENENKLFDDDTDDYDNDDDFTDMLNDISGEVEEDMAEGLENQDITDKGVNIESVSTGDRCRLSKKGKVKSTEKVWKKMPVVKVILTKLENDKITAETVSGKTVAKPTKGKKAKEVEDKTAAEPTKVNKAEIAKTVKEPVPAEPVVHREIKAEQTPSGQYRCNVCYQFLSSENQITQHIDAHKAFACEWCGKLCRSFQFLESHKNRGCGRHLCNFPCSRCGDKFRSQLDLKVHIEQVHENLLEKNTGTFDCSKCNTVFQFQQHLNEHNQRIPDCDTVIKESKSGEKKKKDREQEISYKNPDTGETKVSTLGKLLENVKDGENTCDLCGKKYACKSSYQRHIKHHSEIKLIPCTICAANFTNQDNFRKHIKRHNERPFYCTTCFNRFDAQAKLEDHMSQKCVPFPTKEELVCKDCGYQSSNRSSYKQHRRLHHQEILEDCTICDVSFTRKTHLQRHMKVVHGTVVEIKCDTCNKVFLNGKNLKRHMKTHGERSWKCEKCDYATTLARNLHGHMRTHTREKPYVCEKCGKSFGTRFYLTTHYRIHTGEKPYLCDFPACGKGFRNSEQLKNHKLRHSDKCGFVCDYCGRGFKQRSELSHHRLYHIIEHRWPCEYCDEKFKMLKYYKNHIVKKHPEKAEEVEKKRKCLFYRCTMCPKMFSKRDHWAEHENWHKGHKPWKCQFCGKGFCSKGNLRQHERSHTGTNNKKCVLCSRSYSDVEMLKKHLKEKHGLSEQMAVIRVEEAKLKVRAVLKVREVRTQTVKTKYDDQEEETEEEEAEEVAPKVPLPFVPILGERDELLVNEDSVSSSRLPQMQQQYIILDEGNRFPNLPPWQE